MSTTLDISSPKNTIGHRLRFVPVGAYILLMPFYLLPPSSPQMADVLMLVMGLAMLLTKPLRISPSFRAAAGLLLVFSVYTIFVNGIHMLEHGDFGLLRSSSYYLFNLLGFTCIYQHYRLYGGEFLRFVAMTVAFSLCFQGFIAFSGLRFGPNMTRAMIFFNNPNQLGYWSLLSTSILALALTKIQIPRYLTVPALVAAPLLASMSLSKAALVAIAILFLLMGLKRPLIVVGVVVLLVGAIATPTGKVWVEGVQKRFVSFGQQSDDSFEGRFYDRIIDNPQYWALGAGEGAYERFSVVDDRLKEIHSSYGSIFFTYGIFGFTMFFGAVALILGRSPTNWMYAVPVGIYGLTHNGVRFTSLWLFLAFAFCFYDWVKQERARVTAIPEQLDEPGLGPPARELVVLN